jgi:hypothetical protein
VICEVCSAPALQLEDACVFCRSPLDVGGVASADLLEYLAPRVPGARSSRGLLRRRGITRLTMQASGESFSARIRAERVELRPDLEPELWVDRLLAALSRDAATKPEVRDAVSRAGWRLR